MRWEVKCVECGESIYVRGSEDRDTNSFELDDNDSRWLDACVHVKSGGDYDIGEPIDEDEL